ncbi:BlaI/MecI/CopY family transcriptional regulator, partial [Streptomyces flaveolus]
LDAESDREAVLASFVTGLDPADERLLRDLLGDAGATEED